MRVPSSKVVVGGPKGLPLLSKNWIGPSPWYVFPSLLSVTVKSIDANLLGVASGLYVQNRPTTRTLRSPTRFHAPHAVLARAAGVKSGCPLPLNVPPPPHSSNAPNGGNELSGAETTVRLRHRPTISSVSCSSLLLPAPALAGMASAASAPLAPRNIPAPLSMWRRLTLKSCCPRKSFWLSRVPPAKWASVFLLSFFVMSGAPFSTSQPRGARRLHPLTIRLNAFSGELSMCCYLLVSPALAHGDESSGPLSF